MTPEALPPKHLAVRNPRLPHPKFPGGRIGCWNTVILTACGLLTQPGEPRSVTCRLDMVTCTRCQEWAEGHRSQFRVDAENHVVST